MAYDARFLLGMGSYALKRKKENVHIPRCHVALYLKSDYIIKQLLTQLSAFPTLLTSWNHNNITSLPESRPFLGSPLSCHNGTEVKREVTVKLSDVMLYQ